MFGSAGSFHSGSLRPNCLCLLRAKIARVCHLAWPMPGSSLSCYIWFLAIFLCSLCLVTSFYTILSLFLRDHQPISFLQILPLCVCGFWDRASLGNLSWLSCNSLCISDWPGTQSSTCLCLSTGTAQPSLCFCFMSLCLSVHSYYDSQSKVLVSTCSELSHGFPSLHLALCVPTS